MAKKVQLTVVLVAIMAIGAIFASSASAYGQCGGPVSSGGAIYNSWQSMGVVSQAEDVVKSAGFHRMDGSLKSWMEERVVEAKLASSAAPVDFGCNPGTLFSVGHRTQAKGTKVLVALPLKYAKTDVRTTPHKGYKRVVVKVHIVGKTDCSNPEEGVVYVVLYIKCPPKKHHHHKHHHKCGCKKPPVPQPQPPQPPKETGICNENTVTNGTSCGGGICSPTTIVGGSGNTVVVNQPAECKTEPPKTPPTCEETGTCPPPPVEIYTEISCTGFEEISGNGSFLVDCAVNSNSGKPISLKAFSNNGNSRVSGINCYSNGGSQTCPSGGTFEFRVSGINNGSSVLYSSITATASSGGSEDTFESDPFPVDPADGGF